MAGAMSVRRNSDEKLPPLALRLNGTSANRLHLSMASPGIVAGIVVTAVAIAAIPLGLWQSAASIEILGWPLFASGGVAHGWVAIGLQPTGVVAVGVVPIGVVPVGTFAFGLLPLGCVAVGLVSYGSVSAGWLAGGAVSLGWYSHGTVAIGGYAWGHRAYGLNLASVPHVQPARGPVAKLLGKSRSASAQE